MSRSSDGKCLLCDTPGCTACVDAPVVLPPASAGMDASLSPLRWLFVQRGGVWRHFCPNHMTSVLSGDEKQDSSPVASLGFRNIVLVADSSASSYATAKRAVRLLTDKEGISLTLLFVACGRCMPRRETPPTGKVLEQSPPESYCPGTQSALDKLSDLLNNHAIPFRLLVRSGAPIEEIITAEVSNSNPEILFLTVSLAESGPPQLTIPILVLSTAEQGT